ncbi:MAG: hypothetical protein KBC22_02800 [Candidatus Pacebacteria bacterium]|nr:hypothetical protein [Candidatus Paceibacterota bacterium]
MIKITNRGFIFIPILLGVAAVGLTAAFVYDRMSGGALSNGIRNYFTDGSDGINSNQSQSGGRTLTPDAPNPVRVPPIGEAYGSRSPAYDSQFDNDDDCIYRGTAEECANYQAQVQQGNDQHNFCNNPENISDPRWSSLCDFGG